MAKASQQLRNRLFYLALERHLWRCNGVSIKPTLRGLVYGINSELEVLRSNPFYRLEDKAANKLIYKLMSKRDEIPDEFKIKAKAIVHQWLDDYVNDRY